MTQQHRVGSHKTSVRTQDGRTIVRYHATDVVDADANRVRYNTGGWHTPTTKTRMNQASNQFGLGHSISQRAGTWHVKTDGGTFPFVDNDIVIDRRTGRPIRRGQHSPFHYR